MKVISINSRTFVLGKERMRETGERYPYSMSRAELRRALEAVSRGEHTKATYKYFGGRHSAVVAFYPKSGELTIGCQLFQDHNCTRLLRWAAPKRRRAI